MVFTCGFCKNDYLLYSRLCPKCDKMYKLGVIYGFDKIYNIVDKCLVIPEENQEKKLDRCIKSIGNSSTNTKEPITGKNISTTEIGLKNLNY